MGSDYSFVSPGTTPDHRLDEEHVDGANLAALFIRDMFFVSSHSEVNHELFNERSSFGRS